MDWGAVEEKIEKLKEAISELEEEIGVKVFITMMEEEDASCEEIEEKIERCEGLRDEYTAKIAELELESGEKNAKHRKIRRDLSKEIGKLCAMKRELEDEEENINKTEQAAPQNEMIIEEKARAVRIAAGEKRDPKENVKKDEMQRGSGHRSYWKNEKEDGAADDLERDADEGKLLRGGAHRSYQKDRKEDDAAASLKRKNV